MRGFAGAAVLALVAGMSQAQDVVVYGGAELEFLHEEFGDGTTSYFSGYAEVEVSGIYGGLLGKFANDKALHEGNLYFGYRNALAGGLEYTLYYTRYYYPNAGGDGGGEFSLEFDAPLGETLTATLDLYYVPQFAGVSSLGSAYVGAAWAASDRVEVSGLYGTYEVDGASNEEEWELGATYALGEESAVDLRWYDGSEYVESYVGLSLTWDTTLFGG